jgi:hypothetical protein
MFGFMFTQFKRAETEPWYFFTFLVQHLQNVEGIRESSEILPWMSGRAWDIIFIQLGCDAWALIVHHLIQSNQ